MALQKRNVDYSKLFNVQEIKKQFDLNQDNQLISSYQCAIQSRIMLFGRIFIYSKTICFHSSFNYTNLFGDTTFKISVEDIVDVKKLGDFIVLETKGRQNNQVKFTQFMFINSAFETIKLIIAQKNGQITENSKLFQLTPQRCLGNSEDEIFQQIQGRKNRIRATLVPIENYKYHEKSVFQNISARELFYMYFSDNPVQYKGKLYDSGSHLFFTEANKGVNVQVSQWDPSVPIIYESIFSKNFKQLLKQDDFSSKSKSFQIEINTRIPMMGNIKISVNIQEKCYFLSDKSFLIESLAQSSGAPYVDNFDVKASFWVQDLPNNEVEFAQGLDIVWKKSSYVKNIIEKKFKQANEKMFEKQVNLIKELIVDFQKTRENLEKEYLEAKLNKTSLSSDLNSPRSIQDGQEQQQEICYNQNGKNNIKKDSVDLKNLNQNNQNQNTSNSNSNNNNFSIFGKQFSLLNQSNSSYSNQINGVQSQNQSINQIEFKESLKKEFTYMKNEIESIQVVVSRQQYFIYAILGINLILLLILIFYKN